MRNVGDEIAQEAFQDRIELVRCFPEWRMPDPYIR